MREDLTGEKPLVGRKLEASILGTGKGVVLGGFRAQTEGRRCIS